MRAAAPQNKDGATAPEAAPKSGAAAKPAEDSFGKDLTAFLMKVIKEPAYAKNLAEE
jgi:hypothetical protein